MTYLKAVVTWALIFSFLSVWLISINAVANVLSTHYILAEQQAASEAGMRQFDEWRKAHEKPGHSYLNDEYIAL